jgi:hypothetical protein
MSIPLSVDVFARVSITEHFLTMTSQIDDITTFVPAAHPDPPPRILSDKEVDVEKGKHEHVEHLVTPDLDEEVAHYSDDGDSVAVRSGWRRLLRKNPTKDFVNELAEMNSQELDQKEVDAVGQM